MKEKQKKSPIVSFLVTVYNREAFLVETLNSILASTFVDFEVIVVDDNYSDDSLQIAKRIEESDERISVFCNDQNLGDYRNRNRAASLATGKYLKYLDADDLIYKHSLAIMVEAMEQFPDAALGLSRNVIDPKSPYPKCYTSPELYESHFLGRSPLGVGPSAAIIRRECFESVGGFSGKQFVGDSELWLKLAERWSVVTLAPALIWWRQHEGQQMQIEMTRPDIFTERFRLEMQFLEASKHLSSDQKLQAKQYLSQLHARRLWSMFLKDGRFKTAWKLLMDSSLSVLEIFSGLRKPIPR